MKKFISGILCALIFLSALTACASNGGASDNSAAQNSAAAAKTNEQKLHTLTVCAALTLRTSSAIPLCRM